MNKRGMVMKTILIIEDNADNRTLLKDLLEIKGYQVLEAGDSEAGLRIAREQKPDLVLMDIQMPGVTGLTVIRELKSEQKTKEIKILAVTSFAMSEDKERILGAGCDGYVTKPISTRELPALIGEMLGEG